MRADFEGWAKLPPEGRTATAAALGPMMRAIAAKMGAKTEEEIQLALEMLALGAQAELAAHAIS